MTHTLEQHPRQKDQWRYVADGKILSAWTDHDTARRLMGCWRACEGIPTEQLEQLALAKILAGKTKSLNI